MGLGLKDPAWFRLFSIRHDEFGLGLLITRVFRLWESIIISGIKEVETLSLGKRDGKSLFLGYCYVKEAVKEARSLITAIE